MPRNAKHHLEEAASALEAGTPHVALGELLAAWRLTRAAALAEVIEALDARYQRPIAGKTQKARLIAWLDVARAGAATDVGALVAGFAEEYPTGRQQILAPRLDALLPRAPDPRLGLPLARLLEQQPTADGRAGMKIWSRLFKLLGKAGDPRPVALLERRAATIAVGSPDVTADIRARMRKTAAGLPAEAPLGDEERALTSRLEARVKALPPRLAAPAAAAAAPPPAIEEALAAEALADPSRDDARLVLADVLVARGDPLGELITLQTLRAEGRGSPGSAEREQAAKREQALIKAHAKTWLRPLAELLVQSRMKFERGFLAECDVKPLRPHEVEVAPQYPAWQTVHTVEFRGRSLLCGHMRALRRVYRLCRHGLDQLYEQPIAAELELLTYATKERVRADELMPVLEHGKTPRLRVLGLHAWGETPASVAPLLRLPGAQALERFMVSAVGGLEAPWIAGLGDLPDIPVVLTPAQWRDAHRDQGWSCELTRSGGRVRAALRSAGLYGASHYVTLVKLLEALPADLAGLEIAGLEVAALSDEVRAALVRALVRLKRAEQRLPDDLAALMR